MSKKVVYHCSGFDCPNCASKVERYLNKQEFVQQATIDFANERMYIVYREDEMPVEDLKNEIKKIEDDPLRIERINKGSKQKYSIFNRKFWITLGRIVAAAVLVAVAMIIYGEEFSWVSFALHAVAAGIVVYDIVWKVIQNIIHLRNPIDMNLLLTISCIGVFTLSVLINLGVLQGAGFPIDMMDGVMVVALYQVGELFEHIATGKSKNAISNAIDLRADTANLIVNGKVSQVKPETLKVDDKIIVHVGEIVPADGVIIEGQGTLDMSSLTGEPMPVDVVEGSNVLSGSILKSGSITVCVNKVFADSTISKIIELVQSSGEHKAKAEKFITRFARIYTPTVFVIGILFALLTGIISGQWSEGIYRGLAILVVACPCAIVISVPLAYFAGIGLASKRGIVIKGANYLDSLCNIGVLFVDKTGTLTYGNFEVTEIHNIGVSKEEFLEALYSAESRSNHPIAKAIVLHQNISELALNQEDYEEVPGLGISTKYKNQQILAGNVDLLKKYGVFAEEIDLPGTAVYVAKNGKYIGYVLLQDIVRDKAKLMVKKMHELGVKVVLLSGDKEATVKQVANEVGVDSYYAKLLPGDKTKFVEDAIEHRENKKLVAFAGDGINDTPSIIRADVGYAMGGIGSDMAVENSDVVIMQDHPLKIYDSIVIAKKVRRVAIFNIVFSLLVKVAVIVLLMTKVVSNMEIAVLADTGLTVLMTLNSLLIIYRKIK